MGTKRLYYIMAAFLCCKITCSNLLVSAEAQTKLSKTSTSDASQANNTSISDAKSSSSDLSKGLKALENDEKKFYIRADHNAPSYSGSKQAYGDTFTLKGRHSWAAGIGYIFPERQTHLWNEQVRIELMGGKTDVKATGQSSQATVSGDEYNASLNGYYFLRIKALQNEYISISPYVMAGVSHIQFRNGTHYVPPIPSFTSPVASLPTQKIISGNFGVGMSVKLSNTGLAADLSYRTTPRMPVTSVGSFNGHQVILSITLNANTLRPNHT